MNLCGVTTSVYNFEIQDYSEGTVWQIDFGGDVRNKLETVGRAWSLFGSGKSSSDGSKSAKDVVMQLLRKRVGLNI